MNNTWGLPQETYGLVGAQRHKQVIIKLCSRDYEWGKCRVQMSTCRAPNPTQEKLLQMSQKT